MWKFDSKKNCIGSVLEVGIGGWLYTRNSNEPLHIPACGNCFQGGRPKRPLIARACGKRFEDFTPSQRDCVCREGIWVLPGREGVSPEWHSIEDCSRALDFVLGGNLRSLRTRLNDRNDKEFVPLDF